MGFQVGFASFLSQRHLSEMSAALLAMGLEKHPLSGVFLTFFSFSVKGHRTTDDRAFS